MGCFFVAVFGVVMAGWAVFGGVKRGRTCHFLYWECLKMPGSGLVMPGSGVGLPRKAGKSQFFLAKVAKRLIKDD